MLYEDPEVVHTVQQIFEVVGTFAFAISGIRMAANKHFDWFGGFVCGFAVAIGGGTIRDVMLGAVPFWMTSTMYILLTFLAEALVIVFGKQVNKFAGTWLAFDTFGLALFTIAGLQKTVQFGHPFWVAIIMGAITGAAGGVIRDILLNQEPVILQRDIYAMASVAGGFIYWGMIELGIDVPIMAITVFIVICLIRFLAVKYHISLPILKGDKA